MSDTSQGPGWWRASNGLWYPPEATPGQRVPRGVPEKAPADPKVQPPFTLRPMEPLELERDRRPRRERRVAPVDEPTGRRRVPWGWVGAVALVALFGGIGVWMALTVDSGDETPSPTPTTVEPVETTTSTSTPSASTTPTTATDAVSVFELVVGDCFSAAPDEPDADELVLTTVEVVDCDEPHLAEVVAIGELTADPGDAFPGVADRDAEALALCQPAVEAYTGVPLAASDLGLIWLAPTATTWADGDREVTCAVQSLDGTPLVGSVATSDG